jgi:molybdate transport system substrate-binding protein
MTKKLTRRLLCGVLPFLLFARPGVAADLMVYAAASLSDTLKEIGDKYEKDHRQVVRFNFGASSLLARQIEQGGPADLFFSADEATMDSLQEKDLLLTGTRRSVLSNTLVFVLPTGSKQEFRAPADLTSADWKRIALAQPDSVPAGVYARQYLNSLRLWDAIKDRVVPTENVRAALAAVASADADIGVVYKTDALISKDVKIAFEVPADQGPKISYPLAILKASKNTAEARALEDYLAGPEARTIFEKFGFAVTP